MTKGKPFKDLVLVKKIEEKDMEEIDGVYVPKSKVGSNKSKGEVMGVPDQDLGIKEGDKILFDGEGEAITIDGENYHLVEQSKIKFILY